VTYQAAAVSWLRCVGMKSPIWPGGSDASRIVVYGYLGIARRAQNAPHGVTLIQ